MAFTIVLQRNDSEENRVNKDITDLLTLTGTLRDNTSIIDPIIICEVDLTQVINCNYMTIQAFGRSYFVKNVVSIRAGLVQFYCHVDVLSSFADEIKQQTAIIKRQENLWNLFLNDGSLRVNSYTSVITKPFPSGFTARTFVLAVAGG